MVEVCHIRDSMSLVLIYQATDAYAFIVMLSTMYLFNAFVFLFFFPKYVYTLILDFRLQESKFSICVTRFLTAEYTTLEFILSMMVNCIFPPNDNGKISFSGKLKISC